MKSKKSTTLLLLAVAAVWGIIFYQLFISMKEEIHALPTTMNRSVKNESLDDYRPKDTFTLKLDYRDPMLGEAVAIEKAEETVTAPVVSRPVSFQVPKPAQPQDDIKYTGYISGSTGKITAAIISLNGKELMLGEGESQEGLKVLKNYRDSIKINYRERTRFIRLE